MVQASVSSYRLVRRLVQGHRGDAQIATQVRGGLQFSHCKAGVIKVRLCGYGRLHQASARGNAQTCARRPENA